MNRKEFLLSCSFAPLIIKKQSLHIGYSAITWNGNDLAAVSEISQLGFRGIQLRASAYQAFKDSPADLVQTLKSKNLQLAMFSSGNVSIKDNITDEIKQHVNHAAFVKALGGSHLQLTNNVRPKDRKPTTEELKTYAKNLSAVGKAVAEQTGVRCVYHNHMHQLGETPEEVDVILSEMNNQHIGLLLDVAHYHQGGGKPAEAVLKYKDILQATHLKDTRPAEQKNGYQFCELGQGQVDLKGVIKNLQKIRFKGWNIVELDAVPTKSGSAVASGKISKEFLTQTMNVKL